MTGLDEAISEPTKYDSEANKDALVAKIRNSVIGEKSWIASAFGSRPLIYADYIASGRSLEFLETSIAQIVLPIYGNTHTETSYTGREITALREEARATIAHAVGTTKDHVVLFCGQGATSAIDRLVRGMGLDELVRTGRKVAVFVGPYEHHSNDLPWRETGAVIERIGLDETGRIDLADLAARLSAHSDDCMKIGAFSAASNVTGVRSDLSALATLLHDNDARFVCDFAAAAPYMAMKLQTDATVADAYIDAIVFSGHKFVGGPGASGILVAQKELFTTTRPGVSGGGTVSYVTGHHQVYVKDLERREEAGTPDIVGDIRAGAVLALKEAVGSDEIEAREAEIVKLVLARLTRAQGIDILGPVDQDRIGVISFNIRIEGHLLHYGFVVALLNDLFGIQARGGCSCAGPYAHALLHISDERARCHEAAIQEGQSLLRPGWVRIGYNYFFDTQTVDYITEAILFIAQNGLHFLSDYEVDAERGIWRHKNNRQAASASLKDFWDTPQFQQSEPCQNIETYLEQAQILASQRIAPQLEHRAVFSAELEDLRNFWMPQDAVCSDA